MNDGPAASPSVVRVGSPTEGRNPRSLDLDQMSTIEALRLINAEDGTVPLAVAEVLDSIAAAVELAVPALRNGHRIHYFGAGTSGRLAVLDAVELAPTFNAPEDWFCAHLAGGREAMWRAVEDAEDDAVGGAGEAATCVRPGDVVVGIAASGRTPYVLGALRTAASAGAHTVLVSGDPRSAATAEVDVFIGVDTGPEVVTGSTRMKAATAQKLVLNAFSTSVMVRLGRVYSNLMVDVVATNANLRGRMISILVGGHRVRRTHLHRGRGRGRGRPARGPCVPVVRCVARRGAGCAGEIRPAGAGRAESARLSAFRKRTNSAIGLVVLPTSCFVACVLPRPEGVGPRARDTACDRDRSL